ncbi:DUF1493 family protein [Brevundimonas pondensis]|uniref:DUF1493 family protein n=2 Tax=Brevundimonas pondensis TaxID=2774189 RepID=A0ABX7SL53_9CAUL|nr:DUF1493 family protein [Brevundimonas pondensis]
MADITRTCSPPPMPKSELAREVILEHVIGVLRRVTMSAAEAVTEATELYYDLGLSGEDLADAIDGIRAPYGTDFTGMDLRRYAPGEGYDPGFNIVRDFRDWQGKRTYRSLTVASLIEAIQAGSWSAR